MGIGATTALSWRRLHARGAFVHFDGLASCNQSDACLIDRLASATDSALSFRYQVSGTGWLTTSRKNSIV
jgi:hypothetical protein